MAHDAHDRRQMRKTRIISTIMILLMTFSVVAGYALFLTGSPTSFRYNGHTIRAITDANGYASGYTTTVAGKQLAFTTRPQDSLTLELPLGLIDSLHSATALYFLFDPTDNQTALYDVIRYDFSTAIPVQQGAGVTKNSTLYASFPVLGCNQANAQYPIIFLTSGNQSIGYSNGCYVLSMTPQTASLVRDRIIYAYYGIT